MEPNDVRPFRFGVQASKRATRDEWIDLARRAEDLGFSTLLVPDHLDDQLAPVPALMAAADATTRLRIGSQIFDNDFRHPVVLAKEAATLDVLSGGRFELGLGAGWKKTDYEGTGFDYDEPAVRVDRFEESVRIVKGLLGTGPLTYAGQHYTVTEHEGLPEPVQSPLPLMIGGGGRRILGIAAREADIVGIAANLKAGAFTLEVGLEYGPQRVQKKVQWVREAAGERFADIELQILVGLVQVTDDVEGGLERLGSPLGLAPQEASETLALLVGPTAAMIDTLLARRERFDISYIVFRDDVMDAVAPIVAKLGGT